MISDDVHVIHILARGRLHFLTALNEKFYDYAVSINTNAGIDMQVSSIVLEEASTFFAGQKTAEQVAEVIQNRVSNYIAENS